MKIEFLNNSNEVGWESWANRLTEDFARLKWIGCVNPMQAYNDFRPEVKPLSEVVVLSDPNYYSAGRNDPRDSVLAADGGYRESIYINPYVVKNDYAGFTTTMLHEILRGIAFETIRPYS
ncbi:MAG: hypothetical protein INF48_11935 [Rhodobacter sp.]|nr:hypothetical protein [Rhodobacter sp.]